MTRTASIPPPDPNAAARQFAQTISEDDLLDRARGNYTNFFLYPPEQPVVFVKFGYGDQKQAEGDMQILAFNWMRQERQRDPRCNIHVPEVFKIFSRDSMTVIIMQLLVGPVGIVAFFRKLDTATWKRYEPVLYAMVGQGVRMLSRMPVPDGATPGPFTRAKRIIKHLIFKDQEAPVVYPTISDLEDHLNRVADLACRGKPHARIVLEDQLIYSYTDFNDDNFMFAIEPDGTLRLYIVDFEHVSFLPPSFLAYAVHDPGDRWFLCPPIAETFGNTLPQRNISMLNEIRGLFQISTRRLGLDRRRP
ncbi:hypothetical protein QBC43DRAFT_243759 [Cladorrhinum sp. PSN259]|nr:hypothetical protein QBC43DRAFT_243759 [Cladorrhinum sp. PSN259]